MRGRHSPCGVRLTPSEPELDRLAITVDYFPAELPENRARSEWTKRLNTPVTQNKTEVSRSQSVIFSEQTWTDQCQKWWG